MMTANITRRHVVQHASALALPAYNLLAQPPSQRPAATPILLATRALPSYLREQAAVLGDRLTKSGQEQIVQSGELRASSAVFPAMASRQLPNKVRIELGGSRARTLTFDGLDSRGSAALDEIDVELIESLTEDSVEGLLSEASTGASTRLLGTSFRPDPSKFPAYSGPSFAIVELACVAKSRSSKDEQLKRFYFDSGSNLLLRTIYGKTVAGSIVMHETRFGDWKSVNGNPVPHRIEKLVQGQQRFVFSSLSATLAPVATDARFADVRP